MNGSRQHAPHSADLTLHQAAVGTGDNCTTDDRVNARAVTHTSNAHQQMPPPGLCSCSLCNARPAVPITDDIYLLPLSALDLSTRLFLVFLRAGISTVGQILELEQEDFERLKLGEKSIQEVVQNMRALDALEPVQGLAEESLPASPSMAPPDADLTSGSSSDAPATHDVLDEAIVLTGHRYAWAVMINEAGWPRWAQWYLDIAHGTFPYAPGTLIEHDAQYYVLNSAGSSLLRVSLFQEDEGPSDEEESLGEGNLPRMSFELPTEPRPRRVCYEVSASSLPPKYRDRISRRQRTCWVETPEPVSIRPGYFTTRIGSTPDQLRAKRPIFITEEEAALLSPVTQVPAPIIKVAPAFLLPETLRRAVSSGISRPMDLWESEGTQVSLKHQGTEDEKPAGQQRGERPSLRVPIPQHIARTPIKRLGLSLPLAHRLQLAGITRVGQLLEMDEDALRALSIGTKSLREIARCLQAMQVLPSTEALVYDDVYIAITDQCYTDEQQDQWRMVYVSVFPDRLSGWRSGPVYTVWLLQQHVDLAMDWDRGLLSLDTHTLRIRVNEHAREQGAVALPLRAPKPKRSEEEQVLSASQNLYIPREATDGLLDALPAGEEERRYQERRADQLFGLEQEEWLALGHQAVAREREQRLRAGQRKEAFALEQVAACIEQVEDWYARLRHKPRILGLCGVFIEDQIPHERTYTVREKGKKARKQTVRWKEPVKRLVGYHLVVGAPLWVAWPENWVQKPCEEQTA